MDMIVGILGVPWSMVSWHAFGRLYRHIRGHLLDCYELRSPTPQYVTSSGVMPTLFL